MSRAKYLIAHSFNLDAALEAANLVGIPASNVWCIDKDPKGRARFWKDIVVDSNEEADPIKFSTAESRNALAYLCFSSGTTGIYQINWYLFPKFHTNLLSLLENRSSQRCKNQVFKVIIIMKS